MSWQTEGSPPPGAGSKSQFSYLRLDGRKGGWTLVDADTGDRIELGSEVWFAAVAHREVRKVFVGSFRPDRVNELACMSWDGTHAHGVARAVDDDEPRQQWAAESKPRRCRSEDGAMLCPAGVWQGPRKTVCKRRVQLLVLIEVEDGDFRPAFFEASGNKVAVVDELWAERYKADKRGDERPHARLLRVGQKCVSGGAFVPQVLEHREMPGLEHWDDWVDTQGQQLWEAQKQDMRQAAEAIGQDKQQSPKAAQPQPQQQQRQAPEDDGIPF